MVTRHGDTCGICDGPIEDVNDMVMASAKPWEIWGITPDTVHRDCANKLVAEIDAARRDAEHAYNSGISGVLDTWHLGEGD
jgi:hypothetical protein